MLKSSSVMGMALQSVENRQLPPLQNTHSDTNTTTALLESAAQPSPVFTVSELHRIARERGYVAYAVGSLMGEIRRADRRVLFRQLGHAANVSSFDAETDAHLAAVASYRHPEAETGDTPDDNDVLVDLSKLQAVVPEMAAHGHVFELLTRGFVGRLLSEYMPAQEAILGA